MLTSFSAADFLDAAHSQILARWRERVKNDTTINSAAHLSRTQFNDHVPVLLGAFAQRLRGAENDEEERVLADAHSRHRWQQGYDLRGMVREWGHLNSTLVSWLDEVGAPASAREQWAEFVSDNISEGVVQYDALLCAEADARLHEAQVALDHLRAMDRARAQLLHQASHDLRGSLSVVASATSLLGHDGFSPEERARVSELLFGGVRNLTQMLGDLLDMARLEAGQEKRQLRAFDAGALLWELSDSWRNLAQEKGLEFEQSGPKSLWAEGDAPKVRRVAQNLALNALKYTESGQVSVSWGGDEEELWWLEIADTGTGLSPSGAASMTRILKSAAPGEMTAPDPVQVGTSSGAGEGIGLSIVRRLCALLDASIELHTSAKGSKFRIDFPRVYKD